MLRTSFLATHAKHKQHGAEPRQIDQQSGRGLSSILNSQPSDTGLSSQHEQERICVSSCLQFTSEEVGKQLCLAARAVFGCCDHATDAQDVYTQIHEVAHSGWFLYVTKHTTLTSPMSQYHYLGTHMGQ